MDPMDERVAEFWRFFSAEEPRLRGLLAAGCVGDAAARVAERVQALHGGVSVDMRPGHHAPWALVFSPNRHPARFVLTRRLVAQAPRLDGWELHAARPARSVREAVCYHRPDGQAVELPIEPLRFIAMEGDSPDRLAVLILSAQPLAVPEDDSSALALLLCETLLGEEALIESIDSVRLMHTAPSAVRHAEPLPIRLLCRSVQQWASAQRPVMA